MKKKYLTRDECEFLKGKNAVVYYENYVHPNRRWIVKVEQPINLDFDGGNLYFMEYNDYIGIFGVEMKEEIKKEKFFYIINLDTNKIVGIGSADVVVPTGFAFLEISDESKIREIQKLFKV